MSCGVNWKYHFNLPVSGSNASTQSVYRSSPGLGLPSKSGEGLLVPQYNRFSSGSNVPGIHVVPPPCLYKSPGQLDDPGSPGPGIVQNRHASFPVSASIAATNPRTPSSPPDVPTIILSLTTSGALVAP